MAEPIDSAIMLQDASEIVQTQYMDSYDEHYQDRFGSTTNKLFMPEPKAVVGTGVTVQYEIGPADSVRMQRDPLGAIAAPQRIDPGTVTIRWNAQDITLHDFTQMTARTQFDKYTIENGGKGTAVDLAERIYNSIQPDYDEKLAIHRHADRTGQVALVNGTPKQSGYLYSGASATPTNATGMSLLVDGGSIAAIRPNSRYDFIRPATGVVIAGNIRCTDIPNFQERSARFAFTTSSSIPGEISTGNLANVADNDIIVFSGQYNANFSSFGAWFATPTNDTNFITGMNRTSAGNGWSIPQRIRDGATAAKITKSMFNDAAIAMGFLGEDPQTGVVWMTDPTLHQALRDEIGEAAFIQYPTGDDRAKRFANFGSVGLNYQHGTFGTVKIASDPLARADRVLLLVNGTWKTLSYAWKGLRPIKEGGSHWYRMSQAAPGTGKGLIYCADWVGNTTDWCTKPWKNGAILNVTAT